MKIIGLVALLLTIASPTLAQPLQPLPTTRAGNYDLGQRFARCSAQFQFMAFVANRAGLNDTVTAAEGMARGWKVAGVAILAEGMDPSRVTETEATFDNLVQIKVDELKARYELDPKGVTDAGPAEFEQECRAWVPTQQKLIELMRRGPVPQ